MNYTLYPIKKTGLFNIDTNEYCRVNGLMQEQEKLVIIGENNLFYITEIYNMNYGFWEGSVVVDKIVETFHGINKSRFIRWENLQLELF